MNHGPNGRLHISVPNLASLVRPEVGPLSGGRDYAFEGPCVYPGSINQVLSYEPNAIVLPVEFQSRDHKLILGETHAAQRDIHS